MKKEVLDLIDLNTPQRYTLSIRLASDGFCFSLYDRLENGKVIPFFYKVDAVSSELANIKGVFDDIRELLACSFFKVYILLDTDRVVTVPDNILDEEDFEAAYSSCYDLQPGEKILYAVSKVNGSTSVFPINKYVKSFLDETFGEVEFLPSANAVMEHCSLYSGKENTKSLFVYVGGERILISAYDKAKLLFFNFFDCDCDDDRLFYIMNSWNTLSFSQTDDKLWLVSDGEVTDKLERSLGKYVANIGKLERNEYLKNVFSENGIILNFDFEALITDNII